MLHFIGVVSFGAPLPDLAAMESAARRLGGPDFGVSDNGGGWDDGGSSGGDSGGGDWT